MTCPYLLIIALTTTCHPNLNDALQHGMAAHLDGAESVVVEDGRRGRRLEIREVPEGLRGLRASLGLCGRGVGFVERDGLYLHYGPIHRPLREGETMTCPYLLIIAIARRRRSEP